MISGHGANPIFFNKKNKDWTFRTLANPPTSDNISFLPYPLPQTPYPLVVKNDLSPRSGSTALRHFNTIHKKEP